MDEYDRQTVTNLTQTFTERELIQVVRAMGIYGPQTGREAAVMLTRLGKSVSNVHEFLRRAIT